MPRVYTKTKNRAGKERSCGRCGRRIAPGDKYFQFSFRYGGTHFRCADHRPRQSELTQSKMSEVYAAIEAAEDTLPDLTTIDEISTEIETVAEKVREIADEYREAAEHFGGEGENAERADELEGWADELDDFSPDEPDVEEFPEDEYRDQAIERVKMDLDLDADQVDPDGDHAPEFETAMKELRAEWEEEQGYEEQIQEAVESARGDAEELLSGCPL